MSTPTPDECQDEAEAAMFARIALGPLGNLEHEASTMLDTPTHELMLSYCGANKTVRGQFIRNLIYAFFYQKTFDQMVAERFEHEANRMKAIGALKAPFFPLESNKVD